MGKATALDQEIGKRLRTLREARGLYQPTIGRVLGVTYQTYQKMEAGKVSFRASTLDKLAKHYGVPVGSLFGESARGAGRGPTAQA